MSKKLITRFTPEKETPGTFKFAEVLDGPEGTEPNIGSLYVRKHALDALGYLGGELVVTVETA